MTVSDFGEFNVRVFDPRGVPLRDLDVAPTYSFVNNEIGDCKFTISTSAPGFAENLIEFGNIVRIEHDFLPTWTGFIDAEQSRTWQNGMVDVYCLSAESYFGMRTARPFKVEGTPGEIFTTLLGQINEQAPNALKIYAGDVMTSGKNIYYPLMGRAMDVVRFITRKGHCEFFVTSDFDNEGRLFLRGNLYASRGRDTNISLNHENTELSGAILVEDALDGALANHVTFFTSPQTGGRELLVGDPQIDEASIAKFGLKMYLGEMGAEDTTSLNVAALAYLLDHAWPKKTVTPTLLNVNGLYSGLEVGNWYHWESHLAGFANGRLGAVDYVRITSLEVDTMQHKVNALVEGYNRNGLSRDLWDMVNQ